MLTGHYDKFLCSKAYEIERMSVLRNEYTSSTRRIAQFFTRVVSYHLGWIKRTIRRSGAAANDPSAHVEGGVFA